MVPCQSRLDPQIKFNITNNADSPESGPPEIARAANDPEPVGAGGGGLRFVVEEEEEEEDGELVDPPGPELELPSLTIRTLFTLMFVELKQFFSVMGGTEALFSVKMTSAH